MNPNKVLWEKGDFTRIAETMRESGEALVAKGKQFAKKYWRKRETLQMNDPH